MQYLNKRNRAILREMISTDFKVRYQGSFLGYAWSLLRPLLLFVILYFVFVKFLKTGGNIPHFPIYLLLGIVIWNFFTEMTQQSLGAIVARGDLIRKISIPRWIIIFSSSISALINLTLNLVVVAVFMMFNGVEAQNTLILLPLVLLEVYIFALGISLFLSALYVKFRDISYVWEVFLQAGFYFTPILYAMTFIPSLFYQKILLLNPMAQAIQDARYVTVSHDPLVLTTTRLSDNWMYILFPYALVIMLFIAGIFYFKSQADSFAENI